GEDLAGQSVVVVEDVTTTGGSALKAIEALRQAGAAVDHIVTVVDREEGAEKTFADAGITLHALYRKSEFAEDIEA
ncbi:MAG TPA: phosphoribosyltransferase family protein, partial [Afifellaceae bacterium]|nr:phosphoribosyltransferase family protein [Afifellaceae bacterium]